jgi:hypothetical protein
VDRPIYATNEHNACRFGFRNRDGAIGDVTIPDEFKPQSRAAYIVVRRRRTLERASRIAHGLYPVSY